GRAGLLRPPIPPLTRSQIQPLDSTIVRSSPALAHSGLPSSTSAVCETSADPLGLRTPSVPVRQRALPGARSPPAQMRNRIQARAPQWTRRSKHISWRSLSLFENVRVHAPIDRRAPARRPPRHPGFLRLSPSCGSLVPLACHKTQE